MSSVAPPKMSRIVMERWRNTFLVEPGALSNFTGLRNLTDQVERYIAEELPSSCGRRLEGALPDADDEIVRIRKLDLDFNLDVAAQDIALIARQWGENLAGAIVRVATSDSSSDEVLRFPNYAAWTARFVLDHIAGRARGKWYYEEFESLFALPTGRAVAESIARESEEGVAILLAIARSGRFDEFLSALANADARLICQSCFQYGLHDQFVGGDASLTKFSTVSNSAAQLEPHLDSILSQWAGRLLALLSEEPLRDRSNTERVSHESLRWLTLAAINFPGSERDSQLHATVGGLLSLAGVLAAMPTSLQADRLVRDIASNAISFQKAIAMARSYGASSPERGLSFLLQVSSGDPDWASQAAAVLDGKTRRPDSEPLSAGESMISAFGSVYLLAPALISVGLHEVSETAAGECDKARELSAHFRHMVIARCLGAARADAALSNIAVALLSGCVCSRRALRGSIEAEALSRAQQLLTASLIKVRGLECRCLIAECFPAPRQEFELLLVRDVAGDEWLHACAPALKGAEMEEALCAVLVEIERFTGNPPSLMLLGSLAQYARSGRSRRYAVNLIPIEDGEPGIVAAAQFLESLRLIPVAQRGRVERLTQSSAAEFNYFSCPESEACDDAALEMMIVLLSRAAIRNFARRLLGFQASSPTFIFQNFLEGVTTVRNLPGRIEVELPPSPLSVVLEMSGMARQSFTIPWLGGREVCLLPPQR